MVMDAGGPTDPFARTGDASGGSDPLIGRNVGGKFLLEKQLGAGAMGAVYRARQTALEKVVAIKVMHGELARDAMFAARFHREAKAASRLDHPNSIRILDYGQDHDGLLYIAMEYLDGRDLSHLILQEWPLANARFVDLLAQALGAIAVAHELGITHRDLKPENIMVLRRTTDEGVDVDVVKVCDFGIAKLVEGGEDVNDDASSAAPAPARGKLTTAGLVIGTPAYMSPEQGRGEVIDGRSDLYSMGVILYQLLTGQLPFDAPSAIGIVVKHQTEAPPPPSTIREGVDRELEAVCLKALEKAPAARYQTARDFRTALRTAIDVNPQSRTSAVSVPYAVPQAPTQPLPAEAGTARTELQLSSSPALGTGAAAIVAARVEAARDAAQEPRKRWATIAAAVALAGAAAVVGFRMRSSEAVVHEAVPPPAATLTATDLHAPLPDDPVHSEAPTEIPRIALRAETVSDHPVVEGEHGAGRRAAAGTMSPGRGPPSSSRRPRRRHRSSPVDLPTPRPSRRRHPLGPFCRRPQPHPRRPRSTPRRRRWTSAARRTCSRSARRR
jgi:serine/threonine protein kinase